MTAGVERSKVRSAQTSCMGAQRNRCPQTKSDGGPALVKQACSTRSMLAGWLPDRRLGRVPLAAATTADRRRRGVVPIGGRTRITAIHDVLDLCFVDRFVLDQRLGHLVQLVHVGLEDALGALIVGID